MSQNQEFSFYDLIRDFEGLDVVVDRGEVDVTQHSTPHVPTSEVSCSICLDSDHQDAFISLNLCAHIYHSACFSSWANAGSRMVTCPLCRAPICERETLQMSDVDDDEDLGGDEEFFGNFRLVDEEGISHDSEGLSSGEEDEETPTLMRNWEPASGSEEEQTVEEYRAVVDPSVAVYQVTTFLTDLRARIRRLQDGGDERVLEARVKRRAAAAMHAMVVLIGMGFNVREMWPEWDATFAEGMRGLEDREESNDDEEI
ncbi:hypothetical protein SLS60_002510 [Paraconiothyrium brasiliense]|uniref:RING-type domain-containing protein n=1 Tax=Paraconiothyrium brasiliense TaxID=300254 RepID=A0ABR3S2B4_9PLEO